MPQYEDLTKGQKKLYDKLENAIKNKQDITTILEEIKKEGVLKEVLTTANITEELEDGTEHNLTALGLAISLDNSEEKIKAILAVAKDNNMLEKVLTTPNIEVKFSNGKSTLTPLGFAISLDNSEEKIKAILAVAKDNNMLEKVLTTPNIEVKFSNGTKSTLTPLGFAISLDNSEERIKAILAVAKDNNMLEKVLTTANITEKLEDGTEHNLTPLGFAISLDNSGEEIKAILDVAEKNSILKEVFIGIEEYDHKRFKEILETLKNQEQNEEQKTKIDGWLEILAKSISKTEKNIANNEGTKDNDAVEIESNTSKIENSDKYPQKDTAVKTINRSIMIGSVCGVIAALAVSGGCFAADVALPMLALIGIAVSAALVIGAIAGGISHVVLRPSDDECLSKPQKSKVQFQISDQEPKITILQHLAEENIKESVSKADTNAKLTENSLNNGSETTTTDQQRAELVANEPKAVGELKFDGEKLLLVTTSDQFAKCRDYRNTQSANPDELLMFIKCGANEYRIVGNSTEESILIKSILRKSKGDKYINGNILCVEEGASLVKKMLDGVTEVKVESISNELFGVKTPTTTAQQMVNNTTIETPSTSNQSMPSENKESESKADTNVKLTENSLKPNVVQQNTKPGSYFEFTDNELLFVVTNKNYTFLEAQCKNKDIPEEFRVFVECESGKFIITGSYNSQQNVGDEKKSVSITSVKKWKNMGLSGDPRSRLEMMNKLELYEIGKFLEVTEISYKSLMTPKMKQSHTTSNPQMVNNTTIDQAIVNTREEKPNSEKSKRESSTINVFNENLELRLADDIQQNLEDYKHPNPKKEGKYRIKIHCNKNDFNINFSKRDNDDGSVSLIINMLQRIKDKRELCQIAQMKKSLGFKKGSTSVVIDSIESFKALTNIGVPNSETTSLEAKYAHCNDLLVNTHKKKGEHNTDAIALLIIVQKGHKKEESTA